MPKILIAPCAALHDYEESVRRAGGDVQLLDIASDKPADVLASADGLLLTGGGDVQPSLYGEAAHPSFSAAEPGRDEFEIELVRRAIDANMPIFAICRGMQVLAVAGGGTLVQDIPSELPGTTHHDVRESRMTIAHEVWMSSGTLLERLMRTRIETGDAFDVNSRHHQAPKALGPGMVVSATAPDGVIEAVEMPGLAFCLGVQWHPENFYRTGEFRALFEAFVAAARR